VRAQIRQDCRSLMACRKPTYIARTFEQPQISR
jgi:hypothetical protein